MYVTRLLLIALIRQGLAIKLNVSDDFVHKYRRQFCLGAKTRHKPRTPAPFCGV
jgi:hypothetical protein